MDDWFYSVPILLFSLFSQRRRSNALCLGGWFWTTSLDTDFFVVAMHGNSALLSAAACLRLWAILDPVRYWKCKKRPQLRLS